MKNINIIYDEGTQLKYTKSRIPPIPQPNRLKKRPILELGGIKWER